MTQTDLEAIKVRAADSAVLRLRRRVSDVDQCIADRRTLLDEVKALGSQRDDLRAALKKTRALVQEYRDDCGPCDHSFNICVCGLDRALEETDVVIAKAEGR